MDVRDPRRATWLAALLTASGASLGGACAAPAYSPCPVELAGTLPDDAFERCRGVLHRRYGGLAVADAAAFRLQSEWVPVQDPPGERRATIFRDEGAGIAVVVELRWVREPLLGTPSWSDPRGDAAAERDLAAALRAALEPSPANGG